MRSCTAGSTATRPTRCSRTGSISTDVDAVFVCGPDGMMQAVAEALKARGYPDAKIRIERFATSVPQHEHKPAKAAGARAHRVRGHRRARRRDAHASRWKRARRASSRPGSKAGIELPYSCKSGVCSTCRAKLVAGEVDMDVNFALEDYEVARGFVLTCQSYPVTDQVTVDYDQTA